eukprot:TRINITY_DN2780_c0_g1_i2.p1 TRINITY_DN2780_c0_g1~~TRINITY_DN2780_c0_g1_i2.p1  ORF type:complete len:136 (-),score=32.05 TRINITY_DN2780_c0_g1_i2:72-479(-)
MTYFITATSSLIEEVDKPVYAITRDGRKYIGIFKSFDQYGNVVLESCHERIFVDFKFCEIPRGFFMIKGDNLVLLGEIEVEKDLELQMTTWEKLEPSELLPLYRERKEQEAEELEENKEMLLIHGLGVDLGDDEY